jgi:glycosyltransferase involved in cell wall biosynthesis
MKNIVFVIESLGLGGAEKSLVTLLRNIDFSKYNVDLILFNSGGIFESFVPDEVNVIRKNFPKLDIYDRILFKYRCVNNKNKLHSAQILFKILYSKLEADIKNYDIAIAYNQGFATYYTALFINSDLKYAWLNTDYKAAGYKINEDKLFYSCFKKIIAVSDYTKGIFSKELENVSLDINIMVIKDITDRKILNIESEKKIDLDFSHEKISIVTVGRLSKNKGLHLAIESCKKLIEKGYDVIWYVVGEGSERNELLRLINENGLNNRFILLGMTDNPYPYMKKCTIYVQTSLFEGLGLSLLEASYLNKPIVTTNFPTSYSIIVDGFTGLIAEMNSDSIVEKIELYLKDDNLLKRVVENLAKKEDSDMSISIEKINSLLN